MLNGLKGQIEGEHQLQEKLLHELRIGLTTNT